MRQSVKKAVMVVFTLESPRRYTAGGVCEGVSRQVYPGEEDPSEYGQRRPEGWDPRVDKSEK